ncbi:hypothetical protein VP01_2653g1 [Puccinia sorghi]|uniref:Uncharacterized protein n=1 Tax=Puccinia sorghi TaxID=27349 RepID=A0A0L6V4U3_9BASI|nr:hypothetical protein VP01_2653g1 [Puccinia sorghi]
MTAWLCISQSEIFKFNKSPSKYHSTVWENTSIKLYLAYQYCQAAHQMKKGNHKPSIFLCFRSSYTLTNRKGDIVVSNWLKHVSSRDLMISFHKSDELLKYYLQVIMPPKIYQYTLQKTSLNFLQLTCSMLQPSCHPNSTSWLNHFWRRVGVTTEASWEFLHVNCRVEQVFFAVVYYAHDREKEDLGCEEQQLSDCAWQWNLVLPSVWEIEFPLEFQMSCDKIQLYMWVSSDQLLLQLLLISIFTFSPLVMDIYMFSCREFSPGDCILQPEEAFKSPFLELQAGCVILLVSSKTAGYKAGEGRHYPSRHMAGPVPSYCTKNYDPHPPTPLSLAQFDWIQRKCTRVGETQRQLGASTKYQLVIRGDGLIHPSMFLTPRLVSVSISSISRNTDRSYRQGPWFPHQNSTSTPAIIHGAGEWRGSKIWPSASSTSGVVSFYFNLIQITHSSFGSVLGDKPSLSHGQTHMHRHRQRPPFLLIIASNYYCYLLNCVDTLWVLHRLVDTKVYLIHAASSSPESPSHSLIRFQLGHSILPRSRAVKLPSSGRCSTSNERQDRLVIEILSAQQNQLISFSEYLAIRIHT